MRISYYDKGPIIGLLMDIDIRHKTDGKKSLDDLMRLLYYRFYKELGRGFTEEEFWDSATEVAGQPLDLMRYYVDTTAEIDYERILADAGLEIDRYWMLKMPANPTKSALKIREGMFGKQAIR